SRGNEAGVRSRPRQDRAPMPRCAHWFCPRTVVRSAVTRLDRTFAVPVAQPQRRTFTPFTTTVLQTTAGLRTTTAPRAPAQAARTTPRAPNHTLASGASHRLV